MALRVGTEAEATCGSRETFGRARKASFRLAAGFDLVKGFAVGRTIFADAARGWLGGKITDEEAVKDMAQRYTSLCRIWDEARAKKGEAA